MNARQHLHAVVTAVVQHPTTPATAEIIHAAANYLQVPELSPKAFQQRVCQSIRSRANAQHLPAKGVKRERAYIEMLMGVGMALEALGSDQLNPFLILATLGCARGAVEAVNALADGKELP